MRAARLNQKGELKDTKTPDTVELRGSAELGDNSLFIITSDSLIRCHFIHC